MKRTIAILLLLAMALSLCACNKKVNITNENEAISFLKDYVKDKDIYDKIAGEIGLHYYAEPKNMNWSAHQENSGHWTITLQGQMSGYTDSSKTNHVTRSFVYVVATTADGKIMHEEIKALG